MGDIVFKSIRVLGALVITLATITFATSALAQTTLNTGRTPTPRSYTGQMFDVSATNAVTVTGLSAQIDVAGPVRVWGRPGTHVGFESSNVGWTLLGSGSVVTTGSVQSLPVVISAPIAAGTTYAFYIDSDGTHSYGDSAGARGDVIVSNADIAIRSGSGIRTAFSATFVQPRDLSGGVTYGAPAPVPTLSEWAMILLGVLLAGSAALYLHRRRFVA